MKVLVVLLLVSLGNIVALGEDSLPAFEQQRRVAAEIDVTRTQIKKLMRDLENKSNEKTGFNTADYQAKSEKFRKRIAVGLSKFEYAMEHRILKRLSYWASFFDEMYFSKDFSVDQKNLLIEQQRPNILKEIQKIGADYQREIMKLYALALVPVGVKVEEVEIDEDCGESDHERELRFTFSSPIDSTKAVSGRVCPKDREGVYYLDGVEVINLLLSHGSVDGPHIALMKQTYASHGLFYGILENSYYEHFRELIISRHRGVYPRERVVSFNSKDSFENFIGKLVNLKTVYQKLYYPVLKEGCRSELCLSLSASEIISYLTMVKTTLDRDISATIGGSGAYWLKRSYWELSGTISLLSRKDYLDKLPFDAE